MNIYCIMPTYNEEAFISQTLESIVAQTYLPKKLVIVNDNSTDGTQTIIDTYVAKHDWISSVYNPSENKHLLGSKVIHAFQKGYECIDNDFDILIKLDADLILPTDYFETIVRTFRSDDRIGMTGGFAYIEKNGEWILENLTDTDHIRGAFKAYRKECFDEIGGLQPAMGWDTVDELLCKYYNWHVVTLPEMKIKHLKPTGAIYDVSARYKQGEAFYTLGYGIIITTIAALKLAARKGKPLLFLDYIKGFYKAKKENKPLLVTPEQAQYIRNYRWKKIKAKLF